jgi:peptide chain release factor subunit 1
MLRPQELVQIVQKTKAIGSHKVLSVYLDTDAATGSWKDKMYRLDLTMDGLAESLSSEDARTFSNERQKAQKFLKGYKAHGKGIALFSGSSSDLWWTSELVMPVGNEIRYSPSPFVSPLVGILDEYQAYCITVVDNENARLFLVRTGQIEERHALHDFVPGRHKQIEFNPRIERHHAVKVQQHLQNVVKELESLHTRVQFNRVILAGAAEALPKFEKMLPKRLSDLVIGRFPVAMRASDQAVLDKARPIHERYEHEKEKRIVEDLITKSSKHGRATLGADRTLLALHNKEVFELVAAGNYTLKGSVCNICGLASETIVKKCSLCGGQTSRSDDLVEEAFQQALAAGITRIEVLGDEAAREKLIKEGGIGAFLTF